MLAAGIILLCLTCCYFEFFAHAYSTGIRLVERAQNQALVLLLFGTTLAAAMLARVWRPNLVPATPMAPVLLAGLVGASLVFSPAGRLLRTEAARSRASVTRRSNATARCARAWSPRPLSCGTGLRRRC
ncbi:hypothetical protein [Bradyrhizobium sp. LMG 9283]|uniref:hypothetical protein n=1 Tax=Bradyrhizobium sp. LMG 9283 TaxID=592064 RepID=UPI00389031D3